MNVVTLLGFSGLWQTETTYKLLLFVGLLPFILKQELKEIKLASQILFMGVVMFVLIFSWLLISKPWKDGNKSIMDSSYYTPSMDYKMVSACSNVLVAFAFITSLFPMQQSLQVKTDKNTLVAVRHSLVMSFVAYSLVGILGSLFYGPSVNIDVL